LRINNLANRRGIACAQAFEQVLFSTCHSPIIGAPLRKLAEHGHADR
jgi:hypothetical protein